MRPNVYEFLEPHLYLTSWLHYRQSSQPELTLRAWAKELGIENTGFLVDLLKKKRLMRFKHVENFARHFQFDPQEKTYFETLVKRAESATDEEKLYYDKILKQLRVQNLEPILHEETNDLFSHWLDTALPELCKIRELKKDEKNLQHLFRREIDADLFSSSVAKLLSAGLLEEDANGVLKVGKKRVTTKSDRTHLSVRRYYRDVNELASDACEIPVEAREFQCFSMAMSVAQLPLLKEAIRESRLKLEGFADAQAGDTVFQINLQAFPLTLRTTNEDTI